MRPSFRVVSPIVARRAIALASLGPPGSGAPSIDRQLGSVVLHEHQIEAMARLLAAMDEFGGAMLADPVGTGKTYVALSVAAERHCRPLIVAPAVLRDMWRDAARKADREIAFVSFEALSRGVELAASHDFLVLDEAHHVRNPATRRYAAVARLAASVPVLLLTATPIHNRRRDLDALLALFLGERASGLTGAELGRCVVRRERHGSDPHPAPPLPRVAPITWRDIPVDVSLPERLLGLPPPLPPADGGDGGALVVYSLIRRWASSDAALAGALRRRLHRAIALSAALEGGSYPSRAELGAWSGSEDVVQLAFPGLIGKQATGAAEMLRAVRAHADAVSILLRVVRQESVSDNMRAEVIREIRQRHAGQPVVAFSQYADTIHGLFALLARDGRVAALSGDGARVAGGAISRMEAIARFAPLASGRPPPDAARSVTLLLTTDLLSEGVNLQDAGAVIHLDLPWTAARMEQRIGRIVRFGSPHAEVSEYGLHPPASAETIARIEALLLEKLEAAGVVARPIAPMSGGRAARAPVPSVVQATLARIAGWSAGLALSCDERPSLDRTLDHTLVAAVRSPRCGFVAAIRRTCGVALIGSLDGRISDDPVSVHECACLAEGEGIPVVPALANAQLAALVTWLRAGDALGETSLAESHAVHAALSRIAGILARSRPHARAGTAARAAAARATVGSRLGAHLEGTLASLNRAPLNDPEWLDAVCALRPDPVPRDRGNHEERPIALILLLP